MCGVTPVICSPAGVAIIYLFSEQIFFSWSFKMEGCIAFILPMRWNQYYIDLLFILTWNLYIMLYNILYKKMLHNPVCYNISCIARYITGYICPSGIQTPCWDVIYNSSVSYITCYVTKFWIYSTFWSLYNRSDPFLESIILFGYIANKWLCNQLCWDFWELI